MTETPFATEVSISPGVQFKTVEGDALLAHAFFVQVGTDFAVEAVLVHAEVGGRIPKPNDARGYSSDPICLVAHAVERSQEIVLTSDIARRIVARDRREETRESARAGEGFRSEPIPFGYHRVSGAGWAMAGGDAPKTSAASGISALLMDERLHDRPPCDRSFLVDHVEEKPSMSATIVVNQNHS